MFLQYQHYLMTLTVCSFYLGQRHMHTFYCLCVSPVLKKLKTKNGISREIISLSCHSLPWNSSWFILARIKEKENVCIECIKTFKKGPPKHWPDLIMFKKESILPTPLMRLFKNKCSIKISHGSIRSNFNLLFFPSGIGSPVLNNTKKTK